MCKHGPWHPRGLIATQVRTSLRKPRSPQLISYELTPKHTRDGSQVEEATLQEATEAESHLRSIEIERSCSTQAHLPLQPQMPLMWTTKTVQLLLQMHQALVLPGSRNRTVIFNSLTHPFSKRTVKIEPKPSRKLGSKRLLNARREKRQN